MAPYSPESGVIMKVGYSVDDGRDPADLDPRLPLLQDADLHDKVVLLRVDHNVVKKGTLFCCMSVCFDSFSWIFFCSQIVQK